VDGPLVCLLLVGLRVAARRWLTCGVLGILENELLLEPDIENFLVIEVELYDYR
jgi:hypothetical protein